MNSPDEKIDEFKIWYDENQSDLNDSVNFLCDLVSTINCVELVKGRVKNRDECISKFKRKYLSGIKPGDNDFFIGDFISDLIGIRAVCFYSEEVNLIRRSLRKYFIETGINDKTGNLERTNDKFGYRSLHLQLILRKNLRNIPEANKFPDLKFELQIRTVIQDAWSILDHKIKYKKSIPQNLKRRINRLSALFEIADDEFLNVKTEIEMEERKIKNRLEKGGRIESNKPLDVFRFLFLTLKYFPEYNFIEYKVDGFVQEILQFKNDFTEGELNEALEKYLSFADSIENKFKQNLNPYTKIRYCLYKADDVCFSEMLSVFQKSNVYNIKKAV